MFCLAAMILCYLLSLNTGKILAYNSEPQQVTSTVIPFSMTVKFDAKSSSIEIENRLMKIL